MARTTESQVEELLLDVDSSETTVPFIDTANELVTELCTDSGYSDARLELIERWLAAHFFMIKRRKSIGESAGPVAERFLQSVGLVLANTEYGQQAMVLDIAGNLAAYSKKIERGDRQRVGLSWLGTDT